MLRLVVFLILLQHAHSSCIVPPDASGHVSAQKLKDAGLTTIGKIPGYADYITSGFYQCSTLKSIEISDDITLIGYKAFYSATALTSVDFSGATALKTIGDYAFQQTVFTSVTIPSSVTSIGVYAFSSGALKSVDFSGATALEWIKWAAFSYTALTSVTIPSSVTTIDGSAFSGNDFLASVDFSNATALKTIGTNAFYYATALKSVDFSGATALETIGSDVFLSSGLTSVTVPVCKPIGPAAFPSATTVVQSFPRGCLDNLLEGAVWDITYAQVASALTPQELKAAYRAKNACPS